MFRRSNPAAALQNPTGAKTPFAFQEFVDSDLTQERSKGWSARLLGRKDLLRNVQGLAPEDQTKFIDKVDQVR